MLLMKSNIMALKGNIVILKNTQMLSSFESFIRTKKAMKNLKIVSVRILAQFSPVYSFVWVNYKYSLSVYHVTDTSWTLELRQFNRKPPGLLLSQEPSTPPSMSGSSEWEIPTNDNTPEWIVSALMEETNFSALDKGSRCLPVV